MKLKFRPSFGRVSAEFRSSFGGFSVPEFRPSFGRVSEKAEFRPSFGGFLAAEFRPSFGKLGKIRVSAEFRKKTEFRPSFGQVSAEFRPSFGEQLRLKAIPHTQGSGKKVFFGIQIGIGIGNAGGMT